MSISSYALCTVQNVVDFTGENVINEAEDWNLIEDLINAVSTSIETYCDRNLLTREYTEYHDGDRSLYLFPNQYPVTVVSGIYDDITWSWGSGTEVDTSYYRIKDDNHIVFNNYYTARGNQNIKLIYTAGHSTTPYDVQQVCVEETLRRYKRRRNIDVSAITSEDGSISIMSDDILPRNKLILNKYKRAVVV